MNSPATNPASSGSVKRALTRLALPVLAAIPLAIAQAGQIPVVPPITVVVPPPPAPPPTPAPTPAPAPVPPPAPVAPTPAPVDVAPAVPMAPNSTPAVPSGTAEGSNGTGGHTTAVTPEASAPADLATVQSLNSVPVSALSYGGLQEAGSLIDRALERPDLPESVRAGLQGLKQEIEAELAGWK